MPPTLRDDLAAHKAHAYRSGPDDLVFPTMTGGRRDKDNLRNRVLGAAIERADQLLEERGEVPLPKGVTPHKLRHYVLLDADRLRGRPRLGDGPARPHRPQVHPARLHPHDAPRPGRADAVEGADERREQFERRLGRHVSWRRGGRAATHRQRDLNERARRSELRINSQKIC